MQIIRADWKLDAQGGDAEQQTKRKLDAYERQLKRLESERDVALVRLLLPLQLVLRA